MTYDEIVAGIGEARYRAACEWAWRTAAGTGGIHDQSTWPDDLDDVPHDISDLWYLDDGATVGDRLELAWRIYREMPCYGNTMYIAFFYDDFTPAEKRLFHDAYRAALDSPDDRLADPVAYSLWADYFEDMDRVEEAWREMSRRDLGPWQQRLRRVLAVAGPVPWHLKYDVFADLVEDVESHPYIFLGLLGSAFDIYGQIDEAAAGALLRRLTLDANTPDLPALRERLG